VPYQAFPTKTDPILIGAGTPAQFTSFCHILQRPDWLSAYPDNPTRVKHRLSFIAEIERELSHHTADEWLTRFENSGIPVAPINTIKQTFEHPQVKFRQAVKSVYHPGYGHVKVVGMYLNIGEHIFPLQRWYRATCQVQRGDLLNNPSSPDVE
jgi:succinate--hydroxymethylglutarate CoA-transferase